jgi:hypothetical protein
MVLAEPARELTWEDLVPDPAQYDNPFLKLTPEQIASLSIIARIRDSRAAGNELKEREVSEEKTNVDSLYSQGIDVDDLLGRRHEIIELRRAAAEDTVNALNGVTVRMPGYVLPLSFDGTKVTEFLLVPYVGACIHVPPPPLNQIVHVDAKIPFEVSGMYVPVWVEGTMQVEDSTHETFIADGSTDIKVGYSLIAEIIEPYEVPR